LIAIDWASVAVILSFFNILLFYRCRTKQLFGDVTTPGLTYKLYGVRGCSDTNNNRLMGFVGTVADCPNDCVNPCGSGHGVWEKNIRMYEVSYVPRLYQNGRRNCIRHVDIPIACECILSAG